MKATIDLLQTQYDDIARAVGELLELFDKPYAEVASALGTARMRIAQVVTRHLKTEDETLLTPLRERRLMTSIEGCEAIVAETRSLRLAYSEHIGVWTASRIAEHWGEYVVVTRALNHRLMALCERKMKSFYPVVLERILFDPVVAVRPAA